MPLLAHYSIAQKLHPLHMTCIVQRLRTVLFVLGKLQNGWVFTSTLQCPAATFYVGT